MLIERPGPAVRSSRRKIPRALRWFGAGLALLIIAGIVLLATHWPFSRDAMTRAIQEATSRPVRIGAFRQSYFPPGCLAEDVRVLHNGNPEGPPLITIEKLLVHGSLTGMFSSPKRLAEVKVVGLHISIPPEGSHQGTAKFALDRGGNPLAISKVVADNALLEFLSSEPAGKPYRLRVDGLTLTGVGSGEPWRYRANLTNSEPPGVIRAQGEFGPWNPDHPGVTPVSGEYTYTDVDLGVFRGISGTLQAKGKFRGPLGRIETDGDIEVPNFHVDKSGSTVRLAVDYHAIVNGTNGDTRLDPARARFLRTTLIARGSIAGREGQKGKTVALDLSAPQGRIDDILRLFVEEKTAPLSGAVKLDAKFLWPPGPRKFVEKIRMDIDFGIAGGKFRSDETQDAIDHISKSAQGESKKETEEDPRTMLSDLRGRVAFRNGIATFSDVSFEVPGAFANIRGSYGLVDHRVDLHGVLHTPGKISDTTSGFKALVLKAISPFLKKKHDVKIVPFKITGTFKDAKVGLD